MPNDINTTPKSKKGLLMIIIVVIAVAVLGAAGYYFCIIKKPVPPQPIVWDGAYKMTGTLTCTGTVPGLTTIPMDSTVMVSSNKIVEQVQGVEKSFEIGPDGKATELIEPVTANDVTSGGKADYQFYQEEGVNKFTANGTIDISATKEGTTYSSTCAGTALGIKQ